MKCQGVENAPWTQLGTSVAMATSLCVMQENSRNALYIKRTSIKNSHFFPRPEVSNPQGLNLTTAFSYFCRDMYLWELGGDTALSHSLKGSSVTISATHRLPSAADQQ